jgi:hypothetical protein
VMMEVKLLETDVLPHVLLNQVILVILQLQMFVQKAVLLIVLEKNVVQMGVLEVVEAAQMLMEQLHALLLEYANQFVQAHIQTVTETEQMDVKHVHALLIVEQEIADLFQMAVEVHQQLAEVVQEVAIMGLAQILNQLEAQL